jgi:hypothetical protein
LGDRALHLALMPVASVGQDDVRRFLGADRV